MNTVVISGLFSIATAFIALCGGIIVACINAQKKERLQRIKDLEEAVRQLAKEVVCYSMMEDAIVGELKTWTDEYKKSIRSEFYAKLFGGSNRPLMNAKQAQAILDKYKL